MSQSFDTALRKLRKSTAASENSGQLIQFRLAELVSQHMALGSSWPHPQTISDWERDKYQPDPRRDRAVLMTIARIFTDAGSLPDAAAVNAFFAAGGYAPLTPAETARLFRLPTPAPPADLRHLPPPTYSQLVGVGEKIAWLNEVLRAPVPPWLISTE